jgi:hypothetical protein
MDLFNTIAKAVADTVSTVTKAVTDVKPSDVAGVLHPVNNNLQAKNEIIEIKPRIVNVGKKEESDEQSTGLF